MPTPEEQSALEAYRKCATERDSLLRLCKEMRDEFAILQSRWTVGPYRELLRRADEVLGKAQG